MRTEGVGGSRAAAIARSVENAASVTTSLSLNCFGLPQETCTILLRCSWYALAPSLDYRRSRVGWRVIRFSGSRCSLRSKDSANMFSAGSKAVYLYTQNRPRTKQPFDLNHGMLRAVTIAKEESRCLHPGFDGRSIENGRGGINVGITRIACHGWP
jgi:hypothetical protein